MVLEKYMFIYAQRKSLEGIKTFGTLIALLSYALDVSWSEWYQEVCLSFKFIVELEYKSLSGSDYSNAELKVANYNILNLGRRII